MERIRRVKRQERRAHGVLRASPPVVGFPLFVKGQTSMRSTMFNQPIRSPVLIGREREVATLQTLIDQARQGRGQVLLLSGEAGIGKSRLLAQRKSQAGAQRFLGLHGTCFPTRPPPPS